MTGSRLQLSTSRYLYHSTSLGIQTQGRVGEVRYLISRSIICVIDGPAALQSNPRIRNAGRTVTVPTTSHPVVGTSPPPYEPPVRILHGTLEHVYEPPVRILHGT